MDRGKCTIFSALRDYKRDGLPVPAATFGGVAPAGAAGMTALPNLLLAVGALFLGAMAAPAAPVDYTGHYELADTKSDSVFALDVTQTGAKATVSFSAAMVDGSAGAAPDGDGQGALDATGALTFTFKDSFDDAGTGTLTAGPHGYILQLDPTTVAEPRTLRFYGTVRLKKLADQPQPPDAH